MMPVKPIEKLCELLDEHDEYYESFGNRVWWGRPIDAKTGEPINVFHNIAEPAGGDRLRVELQLATPEQAVAATLGGTYTREDVEGAFVSGYSLGSLPVGSDPQWDENRQTVDEHMSELGWVRKDSATARDADTSRWRQLFGTPERAAETMFTLMLNCARGDGPCERCPAFPRCNWASDDGEETESMMLEWLRGDAE